jgi:multicomponent Na+:H+ antiporter subunit D
MRLAMAFFSALCIGLGIFYEPLYRLLPYAVDYEPYTAWHVLAQLQLLLFSGLAFFVMLGWLKRTLTITLDLDWLYRVLFPRLVGAAARLLSHGMAACEAAVAAIGSRVDAAARSLVHAQGLFARTWASGSMALGMMLMLLAFLVSYYLF